jgi:hypothetical protein
MYLGGALTMKPRFHHLRAFLNTIAALEVRDMIPSALRGEPVSLISLNSEVPIC